MEKIKSVYLIWHGYHLILPQVHRYTLGNRIDKLFIEIIEQISIAIFVARERRLSHVETALQKLDTQKLLLLILWESKSINNKKYIILSETIEEIGRMLGGWYGQLVKQNSPAKAGEK